jgi:hypothetical protein
MDERCKDFAFRTYASDWNEEEATAAEAYDQLDQCTNRNELEKVMGKLRIVWWMPFETWDDKIICEWMAMTAESAMNTFVRPMRHIIASLDLGVHDGYFYGVQTRELKDWPQENLSAYKDGFKMGLKFKAAKP